MTKSKKTGLVLALGACALSAVIGLAACNGDGEVPNVSAGTSTTLKTDKSPDQLSAENAVYAFLQKQSELQSYVISTTGEAVANIAGYRQDIKNTTYKNGDDYLNQALSDSALVHLKHQSFSKNGKVVYRDSFDGNMSVAEKSEYKKVYGFTADDVTLGGFIINNKTLRYATLEETDGDTFTYYLRLAGDLSVESGSATESATAALRVQSRTYGALDNTPAFSDVDMYLTVKKDWTPVSYSSQCSYDCKKVLNMSIKQTLTSTYSKVNEPVEIPDAAKFNEKLGSEPSTVKPAEDASDPAMRLATSFGNSLDKNNSLNLPVSVNIGVGEATRKIDGSFDLSLKQDGLNSGDYLDAFKLNLDLDISALSPVPGLATNLTARYVGDGVLLVSLGSRMGTAETKLISVPVDLKDRLAQAGSDTFSLENLRETLHNIITFEETDGGYTISLADSVLTKLNEGYKGLLEQLETVTGEFIPSLLGLNLDNIEITLAAKQDGSVEKITGIDMSVESTPAEQKGELIDFTLDVGLLSNLFAHQSMPPATFNGQLELRLNPSAVWSGDYYSIAQAHLNLDLTPAAVILGLVGTFAPAGSLPPFVGAAMDNIDLYYTGDGVLAVAINNAENDPLFVTQVDLKATQTATLAEADPEASEAPAVPTLPALEFKLEKKANGFIFTLGNPVAAIVDAMYQQLVQTAVDYVTASAGGPGSIMGGAAGQLVGNMLGATITNFELFLGTNEDGKQVFDFAIKGIPTTGSDEIRLISLTLTENAHLTAEQQKALSGNKATVAGLIEEYESDNATATKFAEKLQPYIDTIVLADDGREAYVTAIDALKTEFDKFPANIQTLVSNASYMADTSYNGQTYSKLRVIYELYLARVNAFKGLLPEADNYEGFDKWDEINALYDKSANSLGITVPAVKDSPEMRATIGEERITAYIKARDAHEKDMAEELSSKIETSKTKYQNAETRKDLTDALVEIIKDFKPTYNKLPEDKRALVTNYQDYVKTIYIKNIDGVTKAYNDIKAKLEGSELTTADQLLATIKEFSEAYAWGSGYDYCSSYKIASTSWYSWVTSLKPSGLTDAEQKKIDDFNTLQRSFMKGDFAKEIATKYAQIIKETVSGLKTQLSGCKTVSENETTWNFSSLGAEKTTVLGKLHLLRFLLQSMLPADEVTTIWAGDAELKAFADDLGFYEMNLEKEIKEAMAD